MAYKTLKSLYLLIFSSMNYGPKANQRSCMYKMNHKFVIDTVKSKEKNNFLLK